MAEPLRGQEQEELLVLLGDPVRVRLQRCVGGRCTVTVSCRGVNFAVDIPALPGVEEPPQAQAEVAEAEPEPVGATAARAATPPTPPPPDFPHGVWRQEARRIPLDLLERATRLGDSDVGRQRVDRAFRLGESDQACVVAYRQAGRRVRSQEPGGETGLRNKWYAVLSDMDGQAFYTQNYGTYSARMRSGQDTFGARTVSRAFPSLTECVAYFTGAGLEALPARV